MNCVKAVLLPILMAPIFLCADPAAPLTPQQEDAESFYENSQLQLFDRYNPNMAKGFELLLKSFEADEQDTLDRIASKPHEKPHYNFAYFLMTGRHLPKNEKLAFKIFSLFAPVNPHAKEMTAYCLQYGIGTQKDEAKAEKIREELISERKGERARWKPIFAHFAQRYEGDIDEIGTQEFPFPKDKKLQLYWYEKAWEYQAGHDDFPPILFKLAFDRELGGKDLCVKILPGFIERFPDDPSGVFLQAVFTLNGTLQSESKEEALKTIKRLAENNYPFALELVAYMYENGKILPKDEVKAAEFFERFLNSRKRVSAYFDLFNCYSGESYIARDRGRAQKMLKIGAQRGDKNCLDTLAKQNN